MPDRLSAEQRHKNMAAIHGKDTKPELIVRKYLWAHGFRYRLNHPRLPGKPDIVLRKYRTCIFVNGCFWHGHKTHLTGEELVSSECCKIPKSNRDFWVKKITRNQERDGEVRQKLAEMGWYTIVIWECQLKPSERRSTLEALEYRLNEIFLDFHRARTYGEREDSMQIAAEETETYGNASS